MHGGGGGGGGGGQLGGGDSGPDYGADSYIGALEGKRQGVESRIAELQNQVWFGPFMPWLLYRWWRSCWCC